ncbi:17828_t:CDS:2 [Funneliformis geosporum]|uniref:17828_t:CDS:1 n=1 Tax=Funneliformis geosporum TaxID=1117311 RepID=A0A9W4WHP9_9GLOM|nr:17828_t:CDS:2 [Funneliformis geosporum]
MNRTLTIDPSSDGTTGYFLIDESMSAMNFFEVKSTVFNQQMTSLYELVREHQPANIVYEGIQYINKDNISSNTGSLFKLMGSIESLKNMKSKLQKYSDQELVSELERRKEIKEKLARNNLTMLISSDIKETIRIPKRVKKIRVCDEKELEGERSKNRLQLLFKQLEEVSELETLARLEEKLLATINQEIEKIEENNQQDLAQELTNEEL